MTDDELVAALKRKWGIASPSPELLIAVRVRSLLALINTASKTVGVGTGFGLLLGDSGRSLVQEMDKLDRTLRFQIDELTPHP